MTQFMGQHVQYSQHSLFGIQPLELEKSHVVMYGLLGRLNGTILYSMLMVIVYRNSYGYRIGNTPICSNVMTRYIFVPGDPRLYRTTT